jgi:hypothetical protein
MTEMLRRPLSVAFWGFWPGFDPDAFFIPLLERALESPVKVAPPRSQRVDIRVDSVFVDRGLSDLVVRKVLRPRFPKTVNLLVPDRRPVADRTVWFTGENLRPPLEDYDAYLSFDIDDLRAGNIYCPLILQSVDWFGRLTKCNASTPEWGRLGWVVTPEQVSLPRHDSEDFLLRSSEACTFIGNPEPFRLRAISVLSTFLPIEVFGSAVGRPSGPKVDIAQEFRYMVCFENDLYPGYVTEKPLEAWAAGCVPIWRGNDAGYVLNPDAVINAADFSSVSNLGEYLRDIDSAQLLEIHRQPLMPQGQGLLEGVISSLRAALDF